MRITYSSLLYPTVKVKITNETDNNNEYYSTLMHFWESMYKNKKHFHFFYIPASGNVIRLLLIFDNEFREMEFCVFLSCR